MSTDHFIDMIDEIPATLLLSTVKVGDTITCQTPVYCAGPITFNVIESTTGEKSIVPINPTIIVPQ